MFSQFTAKSSHHGRQRRHLRRPSVAARPRAQFRHLYGWRRLRALPFHPTITRRTTASQDPQVRRRRATPDHQETRLPRHSRQQDYTRRALADQCTVRRSVRGLRARVQQTAWLHDGRHRRGGQSRADDMAAQHAGGRADEERVDDGGRIGAGGETGQDGGDGLQDIGAGGWETRSADDCVLRWPDAAAPNHPKSMSKYRRHCKCMLHPTHEPRKWRHGRDL